MFLQRVAFKSGACVFCAWFVVSVKSRIRKKMLQRIPDEWHCHRAVEMFLDFKPHIHFGCLGVLLSDTQCTTFYRGALVSWIDKIPNLIIAVCRVYRFAAVFKVSVVVLQGCW